jgi:hypothetical protein
MRKGILPNNVAFAILDIVGALTVIRWSAPGENQALSIAALALLGFMFIWGRSALVLNRDA